MSESDTNGPSKTADVKIRSAAIATGMNIVLTVLKFVLFFISGSMAVLAEAWHSFADIATSSLVLFALMRAPPRTGSTPETEQQPQRTNRAELLISLGIGLFLACVGGLLLIKAFNAVPRTINNALGTGLIFIAFSIGSYFISRFETGIGTKEGSIGLISDGLHARADMTASLLTGFSLILYAMGMNLDRFVAGIISILILSFAVETIINVAIVHIRHDTESLYTYRSFKIFSLLFDTPALLAGCSRAHSFLLSRGGNPTLLKMMYTALCIVPVAALAALYLSTAFFVVGTSEQAVIERFGKPVSGDRAVGPGLHLKWPWPVDRAQKISVNTIRKLNIGNVADTSMRALLWTRRHGTEEAFLSGDNNFFYPYIVFHYRIKDIYRYLYYNTDPERLLSEIGHQEVTKLVAGDTFYNIATSHRRRLQQQIFQRVQQSLDSFSSGIELLSVNFRDIHPPISVADAFERVIAGYQEKQQMIDDAAGYRNSALPESRGSAEQKIQGAQSALIKRKAAAAGNAQRLELALPASRLEKDVAMYRIYLQTIQDALAGKPLILIDPDAGTPAIWTDFDSLLPQSPAQGDGS